MRFILVAAGVALVIGLVGTPAAIRVLVARGYGQFIRDDGPAAHMDKRGTPTMGGVVIVAATVLGYGVARLLAWLDRGDGPTASGLLVLGLMVGLGLVGFLDDYIKVRKQRSLGLTATAKFVGQLAVALGFGLLVLQFRNADGLTPAARAISFVRDTDVAFPAGAVGLALFLLWAYVLVSATSNAVNLTDGLDGLASGAAAMVFGAYVVIAFFQFGNSCVLTGDAAGCYMVRDPLDVAIVSAAAFGACFGFLWWNASPAKIFMGDTGSLAIGGALAGIAMTTRTELLLVILGGLFVVETVSVIVQVLVFRMTRKRVFNMAPIHHHFELAGWKENTVIVRFWIIAGLGTAFGMGVFYAEYLTFSPRV